jgi:hypothetical protein
MPLLSTFGAASARAFGLFSNLIKKFITLYSLRFNSGSTDYLNKTFSTKPTTWTMSVWVKRANLGGVQAIAATRNVSINASSLSFTAANQLQYIKESVSAFTTTALFRDPSAWYHIVLSSTLSGTINLYVNNVLVDSASASTNAYLFTNASGYTNAIGRRGDSDDSPYNGYMSQFYFIDGQQLTPSSFAETDPSVPSSGIWVPKTYTGSYGTEGFFLEFENSASLGTDSSGNGNNWTLNNLTSIDQTTDAPNNNFATWNFLYPGGNQTFTEGNLQIATGTTGGSIGTIAVNTGKWYWEIKIISATALARIAGVFQLLGTNTNLFSQGTVYYKLNGNKDINNVDSAYGASLTTDDIVGVAIDVDARSVTFYKNGVSQGAIDLSSVYNVGDDITPSMIQSSSTNQTVAANFGNPPFAIVSGNSDANGFGNFEYAVPSGYYALCTKNLSEYA